MSLVASPFPDAMRPAAHRRLVQFALAGLALVAGCKSDADSSLLTDSGTLASPTLNAAVLEYPTDTELTDELVNRWLAATRDLDNLPDDAGPAAAPQDSSDAGIDPDAGPVDAAIERLESSPAATQYLARHDFSAEEYVETTVALYQAYAAGAQPGVDVASRERDDNVAFLQRRPDAGTAARAYFDEETRESPDDRDDVRERRAGGDDDGDGRGNGKKKRKKAKKNGKDRG